MEDGGRKPQLPKNVVSCASIFPQTNGGIMGFWDIPKLRAHHPQELPRGTSGRRQLPSVGWGSHRPRRTVGGETRGYTGDTASARDHKLFKMTLFKAKLIKRAGQEAPAPLRPTVPRGMNTQAVWPPLLSLTAVTASTKCVPVIVHRFHLNTYTKNANKTPRLRGPGTWGCEWRKWSAPPTQVRWFCTESGRKIPVSVMFPALIHLPCLEAWDDFT